MKRTFVLFLLLSLGFCVTAQNISSNQIRLINNWQFLRQDLGGVWEAVRISKPGDPTSVPHWEKVSLPHCFNAEDAVDPDVNYYQGPGWYRTSLIIKNPYPNGRTLLHFEGAGQKSQVYVGMKKAGEHIGGYDEWTVDITDFIAAAQKDSTIQKLYHDRIPISIRCDNSRDLQMIPSDLSDFTVYGGLYRYVNLIYVPEIYLQQVHIQAVPDLKLKNGKLQITGILHNETVKSGQFCIHMSNLRRRNKCRRKISC